MAEQEKDPRQVVYDNLYTARDYAKRVFRRGIPLDKWEEAERQRAVGEYLAMGEEVEHVPPADLVKRLFKDILK